MDDDREFVTMKDGRVMTVRDGSLTPLKEATTLPDGTRIMVDGTVVLTDGSRRMMMEGETLYMDSRIMDMANKPDEPPEMEDTETHDPS